MNRCLRCIFLIQSNENFKQVGTRAGFLLNFGFRDTRSDVFREDSSLLRGDKVLLIHAVAPVDELLRVTRQVFEKMPANFTLTQEQLCKNIAQLDDDSRWIRKRFQLANRSFF